MESSTFKDSPDYLVVQNIGFGDPNYVIGHQINLILLVTDYHGFIT